MSFPVWRELKLVRKLLGFSLCGTYNVLSRLKGIETCVLNISADNSSSLQCPFPFEGNWNIEIAMSSSFAILFLQCPFPFEGNWNRMCCCRGFVGLILQCPFPFEGNWNLSVSCGLADRNWLTMSFPVWRELKRTPCARCPTTFHIPYNVLSRLKGIETELIFW